MTLRYVSAFNGYLPQQTGQVVAFVRKESEFALNEYCKLIPTPTKVGVYVQTDNDESVRVVADADSAWEDGASRKMMRNVNVRFQNVTFRTMRRNYKWELGFDAMDLTKDFKLKPIHMDAAISVAMTNRTKRVIDLIESTSNWGNNTANVATLNNGAGKWNNASDNPKDPKFLAIYKTLISAAQKIHIATNGKVKPTDLRIVVSPTAAIAMSVTGEISNYCRESPAAREILEKGLDPQFNLWGLPQTYRGFRLVVEDSPYVSEQPKADGTQASTNRLYIKGDSTAAILARPGTLDGEYGTRDWSALQLYHYGNQLEAEAYTDAEDRLIRGHVSEDFKEVIATTIAGYLVTGIL